MHFTLKDFWGLGSISRFVARYLKVNENCLPPNQTTWLPELILFRALWINFLQNFWMERDFGVVGLLLYISRSTKTVSDLNHTTWLLELILIRALWISSYKISEWKEFWGFWVPLLDISRPTETVLLYNSFEFGVYQWLRYFMKFLQFPVELVYSYQWFLFAVFHYSWWDQSNLTDCWVNCSCRLFLT